ncbi:inducible alternative oxidase 2 [Cytospora paraplurivora]|uniref:Inducible alternative oxidase 2 n=1 Tax=Cytospora paraplurivora TaxID=2898453 RepID=A0AAN9YDP4_9PEZI
MYRRRQSTFNKASAIPKRYIAAVGISIFVLWLLTRSHGSRESQDGWISQDEFVKLSLEKDIYLKDYDGQGIQKVCREAKWRDGIVMSCDMIAGGIGNLKTNLLACARYAIEAGAMLVTPVIHPREAFGRMEKSFAWDTDLPISYMFDSEHFFSTLARDCPELRIVDENDEQLNIPPKSESHVIRAPSLVASAFGHVLIEPAKWRTALDEHITENILKKKHLPQPTKEFPLRLSFDDGISFSWPTAYDGDEFRNNWGHLAQFPLHIRKLSARALYNLYRMIDVQQSPAAPSKGAFLGAHVRTEKDVQVYSWTSFETQSAHIQEQLKANNLSVVYVATGTASDVDRLKKAVANMEIPLNETHTTGVQVFHKWDVLDEEDLMLMDTLTWDQMALVDLDIMLRSSRFVGIWESSWSWTISLKRHAWSEANPYDYATHALTFEDELSIIYGPTGAQPVIDPCLWL